MTQAQQSSGQAIAEAIKTQAQKDRSEAMTVLVKRHGEDLSAWPIHIRAHYMRLQAAQEGCAHND
jgi:hypothetical protein